MTLAKGLAVHVGEGDHTYVWDGDWAAMPEGAADAWAHHDVVVAENGDVIGFHQSDPSMLVFRPTGELDRRVPVEVAEAHGMTLVREAGQDFLWVADTGFKVTITEGTPEFGQSPWGPQVVKLAMDGRIVQRLEKPDLPVYDSGAYAPTSVAIDGAAGGTGDIWTADGYGSSYVHRYDREGRLVGSISGEESEAGRFSCPHALFIDRRRAEPELYVADRGNARLVVYGLDGAYRRQISGIFVSPSALATFGEYLIVAELHARLTICDGADRLVAYLGDNAQVCATPGWPNEVDEDGRTIRSRLLEPGRFNSPHGLATDAAGDIYVCEWLVGGRVTRLARATD